MSKCKIQPKSTQKTATSKAAIIALYKTSANAVTLFEKELHASEAGSERYAICLALLNDLKNQMSICYSQNQKILDSDQARKISAGFDGQIQIKQQQQLLQIRKTDKTLSTSGFQYGIFGKKISTTTNPLIRQKTYF